MMGLLNANELRKVILYLNMDIHPRVKPEKSFKTELLIEF